MPSSKVFKVIPTTQNYDWGKVGRNAKVAQFAETSQIPGFVVKDGSPYAELWMGTHPSSPSHVWGSSEVLSKHLARHPELIGPTIIEKFDAKDGNLPFLFKVLSIEKALSIQSHPDKKTAEALHAQFPKIYKDPNHKPEMALALTPFQALCGFRPLSQIAHNLRTTPEVESLIPPSILSSFYDVAGSSTPTGLDQKTALKNLFAAIMTADESQVKLAIEKIVQRYQPESTPTSTAEEQSLRSLVLRLNTQFPLDIGILCAYLLNYITLASGEAIFLGAGEPHAYISGECIECMANSDNVIRAGLTPKLRDVPNLVAGLTYEAAEGKKHYVQPSRFGVFSVLYDPPIEEFGVVKVVVASGEEERQREVGGPSLVVVTEGKGVVQWSDIDVGEKEQLEVGVGDVFFVGAAVEITIRPLGNEGSLELFRAFAEVE